jgi:hypothetical protein
LLPTIAAGASEAEEQIREETEAVGVVNSGFCVLVQETPSTRIIRIKQYFLILFQTPHYTLRT